MKKYLFGLGAMLVGAGLMFVLMHGEVRAEGEKAHCEDVGSRLTILQSQKSYLRYICDWIVQCEIKCEFVYQLREELNV